MSWNHRVVKRTWIDAMDCTEDRFGVHEAYCDDNGRVFAITEEPVAPCGETLEELRVEFERMQRCLEYPILDFDKIPEEGAESPYPGD